MSIQDTEKSNKRKEPLSQLLIHRAALIETFAIEATCLVHDTQPPKFRGDLRKWTLDKCLIYGREQYNPTASKNGKRRILISSLLCASASVVSSSPIPSGHPGLLSAKPGRGGGCEKTVKVRKSHFPPMPPVARIRGRFADECH